MTGLFFLYWTWICHQPADLLFTFLLRCCSLNARYKPSLQRSRAHLRCALCWRQILSLSCCEGLHWLAVQAAKELAQVMLARVSSVLLSHFLETQKWSDLSKNRHWCCFPREQGIVPHKQVFSFFPHALACGSATKWGGMIQFLKLTKSFFFFPYDLQKLFLSVLTHFLFFKVPKD